MSAAPPSARQPSRWLPPCPASKRLSTSCASTLRSLACPTSPPSPTRRTWSLAAPRNRYPVSDESLTLLDPTSALENVFWTMVAEFDAAGKYFFNQAQRDLARADFAAYVWLLQAQAAGEELPRGHVPNNTYWLVRGSSWNAAIVGTSSLRHCL